MKQKLDAGFSITEGVVSVFILTTIVAIGASLFTVSIKNSNNIQLRQDQQDAIERDLASVYAYNDSYSCPTTSSCGTSITNPDEDDYVPEYSDSLRSWFQAKCGLAGDGSLSPNANLIFSNEVANGVEALDDTDLNSLGISRSANQRLNGMPSDGSINSIFSYEVSYSVGGLAVRTVVLTPTIAAWCP